MVNSIVISGSQSSFSSITNTWALKCCGKYVNFLIPNNSLAILDFLIPKWQKMFTRGRWIKKLSDLDASACWWDTPLFDWKNNAASSYTPTLFTAPLSQLDFPFLKSWISNKEGNNRKAFLNIMDFSLTSCFFRKGYRVMMTLFFTESLFLERILMKSGVFFIKLFTFRYEWFVLFALITFSTAISCIITLSFFYIIIIRLHYHRFVPD